MKLAQEGSSNSQRFKRDSVVAALRFGQALAALNCSYDGARGLMYAISRSQALEATERLMQKKRPRLPAVAVENALGVIEGRACTVCTSEPLQYHA